MKPVDQARNVLVLRLDRVGDMLLTTPFLANLRRALPAARIVVLASNYNHDALEGNPDAEVMAIEPGMSLLPAIGLAARLRRQRFDLAIVLSPTMLSYRWAWLSGAPRRAGIVYTRRWPARALSPWLLTDSYLVAVEEALESGQPVPHEVSQMLGLGRSLGFAMEDVPLKLALNAALVREARTALGPAGIRIGVHLSPKWLTGGWGMEDFILMIHHLLGAVSDSQVLVTYGAQERSLAESFGRALRDNVLDSSRIRMLGDRPFGEWAALVGACTYFVTPDTGALHVASALQISTVAIYEEATYSHCSQQWEPWMVAHRKVKKTTVPDTIQDVLHALQSLQHPRPRGRPRSPSPVQT